MTMIPAAQSNTTKRHRFSGFGGCGGHYCGGGVLRETEDEEEAEEGYDSNNNNNNNNEACLDSDLVVGSMAEDESRTTESVTEEAGSSSKPDFVVQDEGWLQLGIGSTPTTTTTTNNNNNKPPDQTAHRSQSLIELDLLPCGTNATPPPPPHHHHRHQHHHHLQHHQHQQHHMMMRPFAPTTVFNVSPEFRGPRPISTALTGTPFEGYNPSTMSLLQQYQGSSSSAFPHQHQQDQLGWAFRPVLPRGVVASSFSSSSSSSMPPMAYFSRPFQVRAAASDSAGPSLDFRVIDPPRRPHSGLWFMLQASPNQ